jgi:NAD(P)-dependent dehydrogenase (short-subunit alcohol dehydrogenase family)
MGGQVALVTGAAAGLGREIAQRYAQQGAAVVLTDKNGPACAAVAAELREGGKDVMSLAADLGDSKAVALLAAAALAWRGRIDTLVCNAGIVGPASERGVDDPAWQAVFDVNLRSAVQLTGALIPSMAIRRTGSVTLISSICGTARQ